jgi:hypothetical protein
MKYIVLAKYEGGAGCTVPMTEWPPQDITAHIEYQMRTVNELVQRGELVDAQGLAGPETAVIVTSDGTGAPVTTDGPFAESKEFLAGWRIVDVESLDRAIEIAAEISAAPGVGGVPIQQPIEVRPVMDAPSSEM